MKGLKKFFKGLLTVVLVLIVLVAALDAAWVLVPRIKAGKKISDIEDYGHSGYQIEIPEGKTIIALGEATHGNKEFQELKLSVFQHLVETTAVRSFALEADYGEGILINEFIHGNGDIKNARAAVERLSFNIYQTQQMVDLVQWMHDYNQSAAEADKLSFYGFDMQNTDIDAGVIAEFCDENGIIPDSGSTALLKEFAQAQGQISEDKKDAFYEDVAGIKKSLDESDVKARSIEISCDCVLRSKELAELGFAYDYSYIDYNNARDTAMAEVVEQIVSLEKELGHDMIYITGHNGHMGTHHLYYTTMGENLKSRFGDEYYTIGTDYYKTTCNITNGKGRGNYSFCSADPLAYQAKNFGGSYYIRFSDVLDKSFGATYDVIKEPISTGNLGESYTPMMHFMPTSNRVSMDVTKGYDAMIFVFKANPSEILPRDN
jgi:erythromycin esterase